MNLINMLKGVSGEPEIIRVLGALGVLSYILGGIGFVGWDVIVLGHSFDVVAFCAAYPLGLGTAIGAVAGAASLKDRNVASAKVTTAQAEGISADTAGRMA